MPVPIMFQSVLTRSQLPKRRCGAGLAATVLIHGGVLAFAVWASVRPSSSEPQPVAVTFVRPPPPPPPPAAPAQVRQQARSRPARRTVQQALVAPREIPQEAKVDPPPEPPAAEGVAGGEAGGVAGGTVGGVAGGVVASAAAVTPDVPPRIDFDESMTRPRLLSGPSIEYTQQALDREVEGVMVVRCVVAVDGVVHDCRVLKSVPFMEDAVVSALERRRYTPAKLHGRPLDVNYDFTVRLVRPR
jgi:periplasmic protein TonB